VRFGPSRYAPAYTFDNEKDDIVRVLIIAQQPRKFISMPLYNGVAEFCESCDIRYLSRDECYDLKSYFSRNVDTSAYDRIVLAIRLKRARKQISFISQIPNLVFHETDAFQNYSDCKYRGQYSLYYQALRHARIISTGSTVARRLREEGFDAVFVSKGYDAHNFQNFQKLRHIELAFVGSINNEIYAGRKAFLEKLIETTPIEICQTAPGQAYVDKLNDIRIFVSADVGMGEYMIKNFEAMACGCLLFAHDQGAEESTAIGFRDMENVVFYRDLDEFRQKLQLLQNNAELVHRIAAAGQNFVEQNYTFSHIGRRIVAALEPSLRSHVASVSLWQRLRYLLH
jgi:glycosyltransferase involved in cell wall biosynthesis